LHSLHAISKEKRGRGVKGEDYAWGGRRGGMAKEAKEVDGKTAI
jgi:hypothetical protein